MALIRWAGRKRSLGSLRRRALERLHAAQNAYYAGRPSPDLPHLLTEDVVWHVPGENSIAGTYRGRDAVMEYFSKRRDVARDSFRLHPGQMMLGDGPFVASLTDGTARLDGREHRWSTVGLYRLRGEQIAECWLLPLDPCEFDRIWSIGR